MQVVDTIEALRAVRAQLQGKVGVVPTMGALHTGHRALVQQARAENDGVIVTIFVNPTQFAPNEDLAAYPRDLQHDLDILDAAGADVVFTPVPEVMYPPHFQTFVEVGDIASRLEGEHRPGHFRGVATVVTKLFNLTQPHIAYFGQKDAQQVAVIKQLTHDLNFPLEIAVCPTVREPDGLAMSSRNAYLTPEQRAAAPIGYQALQAAAAAYEQGENDPARLRQIVEEMLSSQPLVQMQYVSTAYAQDLQEATSTLTPLQPILLSLAVKLGSTRLIDNLLLPHALNTRAGLSTSIGISPSTITQDGEAL